MIKPKVVLLIFVSGKIVLTGAKVTGRSLDISLLALPTLTFPSACEGAGGDIHGVQHDLHCAVRVPQAVTTASRAAPPRPHRGGSMKLRYQSIARLRTPRSHSFVSTRKRLLWLSLEKEVAWYTCTIPSPPTLHVYIYSTVLQFTYSRTFRPPCFSNSFTSDNRSGR